MTSSVCRCGHDIDQHAEREIGTAWPCVAHKWCDCSAWTTAHFVGDPEAENLGLEDGMLACACGGYDVPHEHGANCCREPVEDVRVAGIRAWRDRARRAAA